VRLICQQIRKRADGNIEVLVECRAMQEDDITIDTQALGEIGILVRSALKATGSLSSSW
jgi:hypothetical protein